MDDATRDETSDQHFGPAQHNHSDRHDVPKRIGRYRIEKLLGKGGFGLVYLARDEQLDRPVAVKVPHAELVSRPEDAELYLAEARTVASLEHPNIVPVHDVGSATDFPCFVVSRFVAGSDLAAHLKQTRLSYSDAAGLVATVAEALHYAHKRGIVHRDVKPGNIHSLLEKAHRKHRPRRNIFDRAELWPFRLWKFFVGQSRFAAAMVTRRDCRLSRSDPGRDGTPIAGRFAKALPLAGREMVADRLPCRAALRTGAANGKKSPDRDRSI